MGLFRISIFVSLVSMMNLFLKSEPLKPRIYKHVITVTEVTLEQILPRPIPIYEDEEMLARTKKRYEFIN